MVRFIWILSIYIRAFMRRFMPSNVLLERIRSRRELKWGVPAMLLAVPYLAVAVWCSGAIDHGAPGWFNLVITVCLWNMTKFLVMGRSASCSSCGYGTVKQRPNVRRLRLSQPSSANPS